MHKQITVNNIMYHKFRHDYYSKTYPRYEGYSDVENKADLVDMIKTIHENEMVYFQDHMFHNPDGTLRKYFKDSVNSVVSSTMSSDLSAAILDSVYTILQNPQASVILSAPFMSLIDNSISVRFAIDNTVAEALSTNMLSSPLTIAVGNILSNETLSTQIVSIAENGIKLSAILGGKEYRDDNNNGIDDALEERDDSLQDTLVICGLGA